MVSGFAGFAGFGFPWWDDDTLVVSNMNFSVHVIYGIKMVYIYIWDDEHVIYFFKTFFIMFYIWDVILPIDELIVFRGVGLNHQPVQNRLCFDHDAYGSVLTCCMLL